MAARRPFWKWHRWKSIGFCLWPPSTCIWNLKLKFQSKLDLCSGNHVVYRQTDGQTDRRTRWIQYTPPPTSLGGGIISMTKSSKALSTPQWHGAQNQLNQQFMSNRLWIPFQWLSLLVLLKRIIRGVSSSGLWEYFSLDLSLVLNKT